MLKLILDCEYDNKIVFNYYPDGKEDFGSLSIDKSSGDIKLLQQAKSDEFGRYKIHAASKMMEYFKTNNYLLETIVAWY